MKFVQLILRNIIKIAATRCYILRLKCTKIDFGWDSALDPTGGSYIAPRPPIAGRKGTDLLLRKGNGCREGKGRRVRGRQGRANKREGRGK